MQHKGLLIVGLVLLSAGFIGLVALEAAAPFTSTTVTPGTSRGGVSGNISAGQIIYQTGADVQGRVIPRSSIPISEGALMMGGGGCASCHGSNGQGGAVTMMMGFIEAPDITYTTLKNEGYTDTTIYRAIRYGINEENKNMDPAMPRWQLTDAEVRQVVAYLKELSPQ